MRVPACRVYSKTWQRCRKPCASWVSYNFSAGLRFLACGCITTDSIATHIFGLPVTDKSSKLISRRPGLDRRLIFGIYNGVSAIYALCLPAIARKIGRKQTHALSLIVGGIGLVSFFFAPSKEFLIFSMACVGIAWASILAMPYVILSGSIPAGKMGIYMGIFNFFITIPQIINGIIGGPVVKYIYHNQPVYAIVLAGACMLAAAVSVIYVYDPAGIRISKTQPVAA